MPPLYSLPGRQRPYAICPVYLAWIPAVEIACLSIAPFVPNSFHGRCKDEVTLPAAGSLLLTRPGGVGPIQLDRSQPSFE